jgi:hypothetical protein
MKQFRMEQDILISVTAAKKYLDVNINIANIVITPDHCSLHQQDVKKTSRMHTTKNKIK